MMQSVRQPRGNAVPIPATRDEIVADIRAKIAARTPGYGPGEKLPRQVDLAKGYDVDRVTIARAWAVLIAEGLIVTRGRRGTYVAEGSTGVAS